MEQPAALKTFIIYARSDEAHKTHLLRHLRPLMNSKLLNVWHDGNIQAGEDWKTAIKKELESSDLVLMLVSANAFASDFIQGNELRTALERLSKGLTRVVPIIVSPCSWKFDPVLAGLQALPLFGSEGPKPVTDRVWQTQDEAWSNVVENLGNMALDLQSQRQAALDKAATIKEKEEKANIEQARLLAIQEREYKEKEALEKKWNEASLEHSIVAYEGFVQLYPNSIHTREARYRIKQLRQAERKPLPIAKWAAIGSGLMALAFVSWLVLKPKPPSPIPPDTNATQQQTSTVVLSSPFTEKIGDQNYNMVRLKGGEFMMGSPASEPNRENDECQHKVTVSDFSIGQTEVTQAQWKAVMNSNPSYFKGDNLPVESVSWNEVQAFIKKLNEMTGKNFRLPTEEEWEYAAGGGAGTRTRYSGTDNSAELFRYANFDGNSDGFENTSPVASFKSNALGLYDMSGNVWEWCDDLYEPYSGCSVPKKIEGYRVLRGGSWFNLGGLCRSAYRNYVEPVIRFNSVGFRLAQD
jgi:formylglycine-generating enzyme required for sulfatase activity